jgi:hypothetical protein
MPAEKLLDEVAALGLLVLVAVNAEIWLHWASASRDTAGEDELEMAVEQADRLAEHAIVTAVSTGDWAWPF